MDLRLAHSTADLSNSYAVNLKVPSDNREIKYRIDLERL